MAADGDRAHSGGMDRLLAEMLGSHVNSLQNPWVLAVVAATMLVLLSGLGARLLDLWDGRS